MTTYRMNVDGTITVVKDYRRMDESEKQDLEAEREAELEYMESAREAAADAE